MDKDVKSTEKIESESTASKVDGCILKICEEINENVGCGSLSETSAMIEALAKLVTAKASMDAEEKNIKQMMMPKTNNVSLVDYSKIVIETDEENPKPIAEITSGNVSMADGYRVRLTPM